MVDAARLRALLARLHSRRRELERYALLAPDRYLADPQQVHACKYLLITAIEDALAAANHVIASEGYRAPSDYADAFRSLREAGLLSSELAERLGRMARFRNLLRGRALAGVSGTRQRTRLTPEAARRRRHPCRREVRTPVAGRASGT